MIEIRNLNKSFQTFQALSDLSLCVKKGEIYGFIGKNGAGKSTTMNIIAGLSKQNSGTCIVNNKDVSIIKHPRELKIGYLPENPNFQGWLTAYETLELLLTNLSFIKKKKRIDELLQWVGLEDASNRRVGGFSRGMKQRLGIACTLVNDPELLIFDEPSSALDPEGRAEVLRLIMDLKERGKTVILSTHILSDVERVCDRIGLLHNGKLVLEKDLQELMSTQSAPILDVIYDGNLSASVFDALQLIPGVENMEVSNIKISLYIKSREMMKETMQEVLSKSIQIQSISLRKYTLEDLFIKEVNNK